MIHRLIGTLAVVAAFAVSVIPFVAWIGLGVHRHASPLAITAAAVAVCYLPPFAVALVQSGGTALGRRRERPLVTAAVLAAWSATLFAVLPVYFPGERREAVATGLGLLGLASDGLPQRLAATLPDEPAMATPEVAEAEVIPPTIPPPPAPLTEDQIALPYEGEGRRLSVPVIFGNAGHEVELEMMFDTGATYTTLSRRTLARLGVVPRDADPSIRLHTANGDRDAQLVLLDAVWLGDLKIDGIAIAVCDDCAGDDVAGLLGLNISGGFNVSIDADRREVVFTRRATFDRKLDVKPFTDLSATFTRYPGGRVEVTVKLDNLGRRDVRSVTASIRCGDEDWRVAVGPVASGELGTVNRKLPVHEGCEAYEIGMDAADW
ncbi:MAG: retropepsin-like aspartic protease, partial [Myxococcota bacterium]